MEKLVYVTVAERFVYEIPKIKGSRFFGTIFPVETKGEVERCLEEMRGRYRDATHHCSAWRVFPSLKGVDDDGEPASTAGKPILSVLEGNQLQNVLLVVTRYFGGTLLGVGGLIQAYTLTAQETVKRAPLIEQEILEEVVVTFTYDQISLVTYLVEKCEAKVVESRYDEQIQQKLRINRGLAGAFREELVEKSGGKITLTTIPR